MLKLVLPLSLFVVLLGVPEAPKRVAGPAASLERDEQRVAARAERWLSAGIKAGDADRMLVAVAMEVGLAKNTATRERLRQVLADAPDRSLTIWLMLQLCEEEPLSWCGEPERGQLVKRLIARNGRNLDALITALQLGPPAGQLAVLKRLMAADPRRSFLLDMLALALDVFDSDLELVELDPTDTVRASMAFSILAGPVMGPRTELFRLCRKPEDPAVRVLCARVGRRMQQHRTLLDVGVGFAFERLTVQTTGQKQAYMRRFRRFQSMKKRRNDAVGYMFHLSALGEYSVSRYARDVVAHGEMEAGRRLADFVEARGGIEQLRARARSRGLTERLPPR